MESVSLTKIGKTYKNTCRLAQDSADVAEHFEEEKAVREQLLAEAAGGGKSASGSTPRQSGKSWFE